MLDENEQETVYWERRAEQQRPKTLQEEIEERASERFSDIDWLWGAVQDSNLMLQIGTLGIQPAPRNLKTDFDKWFEEVGQHKLPLSVDANTKELVRMIASSAWFDADLIVSGSPQYRIAREIGGTLWGLATKEGTIFEKRQAD